MIIAVSGYFNPIHIGHIKYFKAASKIGKLVVILNNDKQVRQKKSFPFMKEKERMEIIKSIRYVDKVILSIDKDKTVCKTLELIKPDIFAKGGDSTVKNVPERQVCKKNGIKIMFNIGGDKIQSSSWLIKNVKK